MSLFDFIFGQQQTPTPIGPPPSGFRASQEDVRANMVEGIHQQSTIGPNDVTVFQNFENEIAVDTIEKGPPGSAQQGAFENSHPTVGAGLSAPMYQPVRVNPDDGTAVVPASGDLKAKSMATFAYFKSRGWSQEQSLAITGRLIQESRLDPNLTTPQEGAVGVGMWRLDRRQSLYAYAAQKNKPWNDLGLQLEYTDAELRYGLRKGPGKELMNASNMNDAYAAIIKAWGPKYTDKEAGWMNKRLREVGLI